MHGARAGVFRHNHGQHLKHDAGNVVLGLPFGEADARVVLLPVPFDATTSYGKGAADGPAAIREASRQVDLFDLETGRPYELGITMLLVEHDMSMVMNVCDSIYVVNFGANLAYGTAEEIRTNREVIAAYLGEEVAA